MNLASKVTANEEFFNGHFPLRPIMPGVLQVEAMAQVGGIIALQQPITDGKGDFFFTGVNNVKWRRPVVPGDTLVMEMELVAFKERFGLYVERRLIPPFILTLPEWDSGVHR